ncbi:nucleotidyltransferase domain-containing protein [candidate division KSB1 bacterium]|nr:nucleotidyltransferase domain-containing protein [candidate division KSB1 bacterium]RQW10480.1 MAG: nucleotidyltransferase domain-containing protein [candidate division KSB1 bacterium]
MLTNDDRRIALELKKRLSGKLKLEEIIVFGSRARGDNRKDSDLDIFIKLDSISKDERGMISDIAAEIGFDNDCLITTFVATKDQIEYGPIGANPILRAIYDEGIQL